MVDSLEMPGTVRDKRSELEFGAPNSNYTRVVYMNLGTKASGTV